MRGQYFSFDAIIAAVIFVMALVALLSYWHSVKAYLDYQNDALSREAIRVSNLLFTPPGPSSDCTTMTRLGFSIGWDDRRINSSIVDCASIRPQSWLQERLGTPYKMSITVTNLTSTPTAIATIGGPVSPDAETVVKMRRLGTLVSDSGTYPVAIDLSMYK